MTKLDLIIKITGQTGVEQMQVRQIVQLTLDSIIEVLAKEGRLELREFGVFEVRVQKPRKARNPKTGVEVMIPARCRIHFKAGRVMRERVRSGSWRLQGRVGTEGDGKEVCTDSLLDSDRSSMNPRTVIAQ